MKILVLNCGSSSIKYQLLDLNGDENLLAKGLIERIGINNSELTHKAVGKEKYKVVQDIPDHTIGIDLILKVLTSKEYGVIKNIEEIQAVGHRVAHGGEFFKKSSFVDKNVLVGIEKCIELAPLHNPANLKGIMSMGKLIPGIPQVAVFDTSFHQTMPAYSYLYGLPYSLYEKYKVRRYGFHGTSHKFVAQKACDILGLDFMKSKIVTCHLGNGASIAAVFNGQSIDTSMGFTPVDGLIMGTRCGSIDPGAILYLAKKENLNLEGVNKLINKESGMIGISGISSDMRDLETADQEGNERAKLALDMFNFRVLKHIGAYSAAMGGIDLIVFTGGIGENSSHVRGEVCSKLGYLGVNFDFQKNEGIRGEDAIISKTDSKTKVMVITTNEELVIARDTYNIVKNK